MLTFPTLFVDSPIISDIDSSPFVLNKNKYLQRKQLDTKNFVRILLSIVTLGISELLHLIEYLYTLKIKNYIEKNYTSTIVGYNNYLLYFSSILLIALKKVRSEMEELVDERSILFVKHNLEFLQLQSPLVQIWFTKKLTIEEIIQELKIIFFKETLLKYLDIEMQARNIKLTIAQCISLINSADTTITSLQSYKKERITHEIKILAKHIIDNIEKEHQKINNSTKATSYISTKSEKCIKNTSDYIYLQQILELHTLTSNNNNNNNTTNYSFKTLQLSSPNEKLYTNKKNNSYMQRDPLYTIYSNPGDMLR